MNISRGWIGATLAIVILISCPLSEVSAETKITISKRDCEQLVRYQAGADVAVKPGVDVRGKKVTGANLYRDQEIKLLRDFSFNLNIDIA